MAGALWHIVRDYHRGRLRDVSTICGDCWPKHRADYEQPARDGWRTESKTVSAAQLSPTDDACHCCGRTVGEMAEAVR